jgi:hypothetical protein
MTNPTPHEIDLAGRRLLGDENAHHTRQRLQDTAHRSAWEARGAGVPPGTHTSHENTPLLVLGDLERLAREIDLARRDLRRRSVAAWVVLVAGVLCMAVGVGCVVACGGWGR